MLGEARRLFGGGNRKRGRTQDARRKCAGSRHKFSLRNDVVDQPPPLAVLRGETPSAVKNLIRYDLRKKFRQDERAYIRQNAKRGFRQPELRMIGSDDEVGGQEYFKTRTDGIAVDGADDGLFQTRQFRKAIDAALTIVGDIAVSACRGCFIEIPPGGKNFSPPPVKIATRRSGSSRKAAKASPSFRLVG